MTYDGIALAGFLSCSHFSFEILESFHDLIRFQGYVRLFGLMAYQPFMII